MTKIVAFWEFCNGLQLAFAKNNLLTIDISEFAVNNKTVIELLNVNGELLKSQLVLKNKTQINIFKLPSGVYILKITDNKNVVVKKVTKK